MPRGSRSLLQYQCLLVVVVASLTYFLSFPSGNYVRPPGFYFFRALTHLEQGVLGALIITLLSLVCLTLRLKERPRFLLGFPLFLGFIWILAGGLARKLSGFYLSFQYLYNSLITPDMTGELALGSGPIGVHTLLLMSAMLAGVLTGAWTMSLTGLRAAELRRLLVVLVATLLALNLPGRAYWTYHINRGNSAALALDDHLIWPGLRSEYLVPGLRNPRVGVGISSQDARAVDQHFARVAGEVAQAKIPRKFNIVFIAVESLRADLLDAETMPYLWSRRTDFEIASTDRNWSAANCTHFSMFSMFSGQAPTQFHEFLARGRTYPFMQLLLANGYTIIAATDHTFEWKDMDRLLPPGVSVPRRSSQDWSIMDRDRVSDFLSRLERGSRGPFFEIFWFTSTHWPYAFPPEEQLFRPFAPPHFSFSFDPKEVELVRNRYRNAGHFVDSQIERILTGIKAKGRWEDTIVVITGDHGEEFGESGQMRHGGKLNAFQSRTPLLIHLPAGVPHPLLPPAATSHMDIVPTLLEALGLPSGALETQGKSLLGPLGKREFMVLAEHGYERPHYLAIVTEHYFTRWKRTPTRLLFSGANRYDGSPVSDDSWQSEVFTDSLSKTISQYLNLPSR